VAVVTGWADGPLAAYDCESTGVDVETARIVTACVATVNDGATRAATWLADPGIDIPPEAVAIHGVTTEHAREHGESAAVVCAQVAGRLADASYAGTTAGPSPSPAP
jgi:DNA polymerase-3 subunit epsilon